MGRTIPVNKNAGIFVTLNPAGKGYGGRSKLPDNLKQLFRPVAMSAPDLEQIAETYLFSEGFKEAKKLATKMVSLFKLCSQLLSPQKHYDWLLRAQKTIISTAGQLVQQELKKGRKLTYDGEALIVIKSIRVNTMSKLTFEDAILYEQLQSDMFPGSKSEEIAFEDLTAAIKKVVEELKLENIEKQVQKILQFYEATKQRMGIVIVGPSGCGKTTIWKILKMAYEKMGQSIITHVMNPKSMPREQLLGVMNNDTREFQDGVLTASARLVVKEPQDTLCWIVNDGDIDPEWIESLNSVLDDNHLLTLPNGERISFGDNVNFIFETSDLKYASPATVTRLGMIFLSEEDVEIQRSTKTWMKKQPEKMVNNLEAWMNDILFPAVQWALDNTTSMITETTKVGTVNNALAYMVNVS
jgi:dynein heavy chain 2